MKPKDVHKRPAKCINLTETLHYQLVNY